jgi:hypothetical protein
MAQISQFSSYVDFCQHKLHQLTGISAQNTGQEFDGSDSGARPEEAVSWGKIRADAQSVKVLLQPHLCAAVTDIARYMRMLL